jgi:hypothetical protein
MTWLRKLLPDSSVETHYVRAGADFGDAVSSLFMGECIGFEKLLTRWGGWENEYARRGFRTVSIDRFVELGGYERSIDALLGRRRVDGEEPIFHAKIYSERFLGKVRPVVDIGKMMADGQPQSGTYTLPSTER